MTSWFQPRISKVLIASLNQTCSESWPRQRVISQDWSGPKTGFDSQGFDSLAKCVVTSVITVSYIETFSPR